MVRLAFVTTAVLLCAAISGCGDTAIAPSQPSTSQPVPLSGSYTITVTAASSCSTLPAPFRSRTYRGGVRPADMSGSTIELPLEGDSFQPGQQILWAVAGNNRMTLFVSSREAFTRWLEEAPIVERVAPGAVLLMGVAEVPLPLPSTTLETELNGTYSYCPVGETDSFGLFRCTVQSFDCRSDRHQLKLEPR